MSDRKVPLWERLEVAGELLLALSKVAKLDPEDQEPIMRRAEIILDNAQGLARLKDGRP